MIDIEKLKASIKRMEIHSIGNMLEDVFNRGIQAALNVIKIYEEGEKRRDELKREVLNAKNK